MCLCVCVQRRRAYVCVCTIYLYSLSLTLLVDVKVQTQAHTCTLTCRHTHRYTHTHSFLEYSIHTLISFSLYSSFYSYSWAFVLSRLLRNERKRTAREKMTDPLNYGRKHWTVENCRTKLLIDFSYFWLVILCSIKTKKVYPVQSSMEDNNTICTVKKVPGPRPDGACSHMHCQHHEFWYHPVDGGIS